MAIFREFAPARINLTLEVLGKRPDGYHELQSLVAFADVGDVITLDTSRPVRVTVSGPFGGTVAGANLIDTTLQLIADAAPGLTLGAVHLEKNLPVAAGVGGGSADAAAVIRAVRAANGAVGDAMDWAGLALKLGADVPVCVASRLSWMSGIGERVAVLALAEPAPLPAVMVNPLVAVPADKTARVFRALGAPPVEPRQAPAQGRNIATRDDLIASIAGGRNDLETPARAIVPSIDAVIAALSATPGQLATRMSGGGPTCFAVYEDDAASAAAAALISREHPSWWVRATTLNTL